jgi:acyl-CoA thioesterase
MPAAAPPQSVDSVVFNPSFMPSMTTCWETRVVGPQPFSGGDRAQFTVWQRLPERRPWDALSVAAMCDAVIPAITPRLLPARFGFPSIDLTIHFRRIVPDNVGGDDFLLGHHRTRLSAGGFFEQDAQIWTRDGLLLAQARQLMALLERRR